MTQDDANTKKAVRYAMIAAMCFFLASGVYTGTIVGQVTHGHRISYLNVALAVIFLGVGAVMLVRAKRLKAGVKKVT